MLGKRKLQDIDKDGLDLSLSLSLPSSIRKSQSPPPPPPPPPPPTSRPRLSQQQLPLPTASKISTALIPYQESAPSRTNCRHRRAQKRRHNETIAPPYPWATNKSCHVQTLEYLYANNLVKISGEVQCKKCNHRRIIELDLQAKFSKISSYIIANMGLLHDRAPKCWLNPEIPDCKQCGLENSMKPVMSENKDQINWLFLLLGQMLGFCTLDQLKYFCMQTGHHRTGAKDRVLYHAYLGLCKQLDPHGPFDL